jgi:hypothetical protein
MHKAGVIDHRQISNGAIAVRGRCCGDPATDSTATIYLTGAETEAEIQALIQEHLGRIEARHAAVEKAREVLEALEAKKEQK